MKSWMDAIDRLQSIGYSIVLDGGKLIYAYRGKGSPTQDEITPLFEEVRQHKAEVFDYLRLLQIPQAKLERPLLIESGYLKDRFYLVANENQAQEIEQGGGVAYLPEEIHVLLGNSAGMDEGTLKDYLCKVHLCKVHGVKKAFPGARVESLNSLTLPGNVQKGYES